MRGVLVHHDKTVAGLRHDIGLVDLRPRRAQRAVEQIGGRLFLKADVRRGRADVERGLSRFGKRRRRRAFEGRPRSDRIGRRAPPVPIGRARREGRAERGNRGAVAVGRGALAFAGQPLLQRVHDQRADQAGIAEPHLGLGRMHIGIDLAGIERHEQRHHGMAVARQIVGIGRAHRAENELVAHRPAVDEQILPERVGARQRRRRGKTFDHDAFALGAHLNGAGAKIRAQDVAEPRQPAAGAGQRRGPGNRRAFLAGQREGDIRPRHRKAPHHLADRFGLGAVGLEKFQPRRRGVEEIADLDAGALARAPPA